ncbi:uncharacterized protein LOC141594507 [Silene latifolia]|uniref:uncharacterized protein LOC141594507 n=1 Tax=Silene latifolia TaxID=37657 RepID=UPI003D77ED61
MPGDDGKGSKNKIIPNTSPLYLHQSDSTSLMLTQIIFNGDNYDLWAPAVKNGLDAKNKLGFIEGKVKKPIVDNEEDDIESVAWRQCNAMLKAWLRNVIDIKLHPSIAFEQPISEVWEELKSRYSAGNALRVHQLKGDLAECKQGRLPVVEYYTKLKTIWDELANYSKIPNCTCGAAVAIAKDREEEKVHQFLMGLDNNRYGHIRSNLLMEDPITTLPRAYALVLREERHSSITKEKEENLNEAAMAIKSYGAAKGKGSYSRKDEEDESEYSPPYCSHCNKYYHAEENCYDKHGYETVKARERGRGRRGGYGRGRGRGRSQGRGQRDNYQANAMSNLSNSKEAETSKKNLSLTNDEIERVRILLNVSPEGSEKLTGLPDGRKIKAQEHGKIILSDDFVLKDDPVSRKEIGRGEHHDGVYTFKSSKEEVASKVTMSKDGELWHKRLGHPSRSKSLSFSALVNYNLNWNSSQICDSCCRAKQTRNSFSLNNKRCDELFGLIHVDIWGKYPIASLSRAHYFLTIVDDHSRGVWIYLMQDKSEAMEYVEDDLEGVEREDFHGEEEVETENLNEGDSAVSTETAPPSTQIENSEQLGRGARERKEPYWAKDYVCKSTRIVKPIVNAHPDQLNSKKSGTRYPLVNYVDTNCFTNSHKAFLTNIDKVREPVYYHEAAGNAKWREAMNKEIEALENNGTWQIVQLPNGKKPIGCKWVYKVKYKADGSIERYKARLVAQGFTQVEGIDYHETYAPVAKMTSVRCLLTVALAKKWSIEQLDVNNAFIHGDLEEEVYMRIPQGFERKGQNRSTLDKHFGIKDLGRLKYFLGIEVAHGTEGLFLNQRKYALGIIEEAGMSGAKPVNTPMLQHHQLELAKSDLLKDAMKYRRLVGRLVYLTITRPDLVYSVHMLSRFVSEPRKEHWDAALRVVRYVKMNPSKGISLSRGSNLELRGYCDSDYGRCPLTRRSLSGYFVSLGSSPVSWRAKKQATVSKSTAEAEYRAMGSATSELIWVKSFLASLGVFHTKPMELCCENQAAIHIAKNPVFHDRTKHIEIDCHFVRQHLVENTIKMVHVRSKEQVADLFTKALGGEAFDYLQGKLGLGLPGAPT